MIAAHGATITLDGSTLTITYSPLLTALSQSGDHTRVIDLTSVTGVEVTTPSALSCGTVELTGDTSTVITFSPNQAQQAQALATDITTILGGGIPTMLAGGESGDPGASGIDGTDGVDEIDGFDFIAFDVETANNDWGSICQIGLVRYENGVEVESASWLCTPPEPLNFFEPANIAIHGITAEQVAGEPGFAEVLPKMVDFVGGLPLVAHNAQFDFTAISRACAAAGITTPVFNFGCSLALSRSSRLKFHNHRLPTVAQALGVELRKHHDATEDARACAGITIELARRQHHQGGFIDFIHGQGFTLGSLDTERVYPVLRDRSGANVSLQRRRLGLDARVVGTPTTPTTSTTPAPAATGGRAEDEASTSTPPKPAAREKPRGRAPWDKVSTPEVIPDPNPDADPNGLLFGQNVTLTGDFEPYEKGALWQRIADQGGQVGKNVTRKTTILVAGPWATITSKQKRAEELKEKGQDIQIWDDKQLFAALGLDEQPPF